MGYTIKCYHCKMPLYTVQRIKFPLDYRTLVPASDAVDRVYDDPVCSFCERLFQVAPHDMSMRKISMAPVLTDRGIIEKNTNDKCRCGCGENVSKQGAFASRVHKAKFFAKGKKKRATA